MATASQHLAAHAFCQTCFNEDGDDDGDDDEDGDEHGDEDGDDDIDGDGDGLAAFCQTCLDARQLNE